MEPRAAADEVVEVATSPPYLVRVGPGALAHVSAACGSASGVALLVDQRVESLHGALLDAQPRLRAAPRLSLEGGEAAKTFGVLERALDFLTDAGLDRQGCVVTFGGGSLGDLGGLAASLYKRGVAVVHAPTTLLAQVDASVGGKTAINLRGGKNLAGTFHQPRAVCADTTLLATLDPDELRSGLGEVVKTAMLAGEATLARLEVLAPALGRRDAAALTELVAACVRHKARVVAQDPLERGLRRSLNLGHTFGHAIESVAGYGRVPHGVAVAVGLSLALRAAESLGLCSDPDYPGRIRALLQALGLCSSLQELRRELGQPLSGGDLLAAMAHDKKGAVGAPELVVPAAPGSVEPGVRATAEQLSSWLA